MLDPKLLRTNLESIVEQLRIKKYDFDTGLFNELEQQRKLLQVDTQQLQSERNSKSKAIGKAKAQGDDIQPLLDEVAALGDKLKQAENALDELQNKLSDLLLGMPNIPDESIPAGNTEDDNIEVLVWGDKPVFDFEIKDHIDLGAGLGGMDFERAAKLSGSRFVSMTGPLVTLQRALIQFMIHQHTSEHGYTHG
jgi:seryl-tRNA synthetase